MTRTYSQTSPHFHQSNGLVERAIQTVNRALENAKLANEDHYLSILLLNSQATKNALSPAHKLFNRPTRTNVPSVKPQPKPSTTEQETVAPPQFTCLQILSPHQL